MIVTAYKPLKHFQYIQELVISHNMDPDLAIDVPMWGLIAFENQEVVAAGFLRCVEGDRAMLDSYITHASASAQVRNRALDLITYKLLKIAKHHQIRQVLAFSKDLNTIKRASNHGMVTLSDHVFQIISLV